MLSEYEFPLISNLLLPLNTKNLPASALISSKATQAAVNAPILSEFKNMYLGVPLLLYFLQNT